MVEGPLYFDVDDQTKVVTRCDLELLSLKELHDIDFGRRRLVQVADELAAMVQDLGFSVLFGVVDEQHVAIFNLTEVVVEDIVHLAGTLRE